MFALPLCVLFLTNSPLRFDCALCIAKIQIRTCRDGLLSILLKVMQFEFSLVKLYLQKNHSLRGISLLLAWKLQSQNKSITYARSMEEGILVGLAELHLHNDSSIVLEKIVTHLDLIALQQSRSKARPDDLTKLLTGFNQLCRDALRDNSSFFAYIAFVDKEGKASQITIGERSTFHNLTAEIGKVMDDPKHLPDEPICDALSGLSSPPRFRNQMYLLNLLPVFHEVHSKDRSSRNIPLYVAWQRLALRSLVLHEKTDLIAVTDAFTKLQSSAAASNTPLIRRSRTCPPHQRLPKKRKLQTPHKQRLKQFLQQSVESLQFTPSVSILASFRNGIERYGCVRVLRQSDVQLDVIWNAFNVETGVLSTKLQLFRTKY